ncbi:uncharacterized protein LOC116340628 [Contarinia nasturtii]|uniref:uncharacterized protein LOC116340628 n=1 Tax=Contarinia nasturtii TaxID=265458 RepID=UPI0012D3754D|nr:uncharacterized protein LOC116340628 [Contarinia nasturtii]
MKHLIGDFYMKSNKANEQCGKSMDQNKIDMYLITPVRDRKTSDRKRVPNAEAYSAEYFKSIAKKISAADIIESSSNSNESAQSDISRNVILSRKLEKMELKQREKQQTYKDLYSIDGTPYIIEKNEINFKTNEIIKKITSKSSVIDFTCAGHEKSFYNWILEKRNCKKMNDNSCLPFIDPEMINNNRKPNLNLINSDMKDPQSSIQRPSSSCSIVYHSVDRYGIPFTMINKAKKYQEKMDIQKNILKKVRRAHMGCNQPPSNDDSSDGDSVQNVKRLALVRTPYFLLPTIKRNCVRRKERFRNKYLRNSRLNRINCLLYRKLNPKLNDNPMLATTILEKHFSIPKTEHLIESEHKDSLTSSNPIRLKLCSIINSKYTEVERINKFHERNTPRFEIFNKHVTNTFESVLPSDNEKIIKKKCNDQGINDEYISHKLFKRKKQFRTWKLDEIEGPLYTDPFLIDKTECGMRAKFYGKHRYYKSLLKTKFGLRKRLEINDEPCILEKIGANDDPNNPIFPTNWDTHYVHDMRRRRTKTQFCVKSDCSQLRDIFRKNFLIYYIQESIYDLKSRQISEDCITRNVEVFGQKCHKLFIGWSEDAYEKLIEKNKTFRELQSNNKIIWDQYYNTVDTYNKLKKDVSLSEYRWKFIYRIENYYHMLMDLDRRQISDSTNFDTKSKLVCPRDAIKCAKNSNFIQPTSKQLKNSVKMLLDKSFGELNENNKTMWLFKDFQLMYKTLRDKINEYEKQQAEKVEIFERKMNLCVTRTQWLRKNGEHMLTNVLSKGFSNSHNQKVVGTVNALYMRITEKVETNQQFVKNIKDSNNFRLIHKHLMELLQILDNISTDILIICRDRVRKKYLFKDMESKKAILAQNRFEILKKQIKNQFV